MNKSLPGAPLTSPSSVLVHMKKIEERNAEEINEKLNQKCVNIKNYVRLVRI